MVTSLACLCSLDDAILPFPAKSYSSHIFALLLTILFPKFSALTICVYLRFFLSIIFNFQFFKNFFSYFSMRFHRPLCGSSFNH